YLCFFYILFVSYFISYTSHYTINTTLSLHDALPISSTPIDAGPDIYVCEGTSTVTMDGDVGGIQAYEWEWSDNGAGGSFSSIGTYDPPPYTVWETCYTPWLGIPYPCNPTTIDPPVRNLYATNSTYTLPPGAQAGDVITISLISNNVWNPLCDPIVNTMQVYVLESPTATITNAATICQGDNVVVTGTPNTTVTYTDGTNSATFLLDASGTVTFSGLGAGTYTLTGIQYTNTPNSNGVGCINSLSESVIINEPPTISAPADVTICEGDTVDLSAATIGGTNYIGTW